MAALVWKFTIDGDDQPTDVRVYILDHLTPLVPFAANYFDNWDNFFRKYTDHRQTVDRSRCISIGYILPFITRICDDAHLPKIWYDNYRQIIKTNEIIIFELLTRKTRFVSRFQLNVNWRQQIRNFGPACNKTNKMYYISRHVVLYVSLHRIYLQQVVFSNCYLNKLSTLYKRSYVLGFNYLCIAGSDVTSKYTSEGHRAKRNLV